MAILRNQTRGGRSGTTGRRILSVSPQSRLADRKTNEGLLTGVRDLYPMETSGDQPELDVTVKDSKRGSAGPSIQAWRDRMARECSC